MNTVVLAPVTHPAFLGPESRLSEVKRWVSSVHWPLTNLVTSVACGVLAMDAACVYTSRRRMGKSCCPRR